MNGWMDGRTDRQTQTDRLNNYCILNRCPIVLISSPGSFVVVVCLFFGGVFDFVLYIFGIFF